LKPKRHGWLESEAVFLVRTKIFEQTIFLMQCHGVKEISNDSNFTKSARDDDDLTNDTTAEIDVSDFITCSVMSASSLYSRP